MHVNISDTFTLRGFNSTFAPGFRKTLGTQFHHGDNYAVNIKSTQLTVTLTFKIQ